MKNHKYHCCQLFDFHFHFADIFIDFSRRLNFAENKFRDTPCGLNFTDEKFVIFSADYVSQNRRNP